ncbi:hypothetical protein ABNF97_33975 [Plantactinospora sp. B6F1]|uniref:hypothetical protein n=1 Tax=Plantactinospora sp. B6F1 TaxID=3158971 RepID=UPI0032D9AA19
MNFKRGSALIAALTVLTIAGVSAPAMAEAGVDSDRITATQHDNGRAGEGASQETPSDLAIMSCYGSARSYDADSYNGGPGRWPATGYATTTSNCIDINVKPNQGEYVKACLYQSSTGSWRCNDYRWIPGGTWGEAATDVLNGTRFYLLFDMPSLDDSRLALATSARQP